MRSCRTVNLLIETGSNWNYTHPNFVSNAMRYQETFEAVTIGESVLITHHKVVNLFNHSDKSVNFLLYSILKDLN